MTLEEFKAWFDGFTENVSKQPTQRQWKRIVERVGEIQPDATYQPWQPYRQPWWPQWYTYSTDSNTWTVSAHANNIGQIEANSMNETVTGY